MPIPSDVLYESLENYLNDNKLSHFDKILPYIKNKMIDNDLPLLFNLVNYPEVLQYCEKSKVDFFQKDLISGAGLLNYALINADDKAFMWVLSWYAEHGDVEDPTSDGITVLMTALKFGLVERARLLIKYGASTTSVGYNNLTPLRQAFLCTEGEEMAIKCLELIWDSSTFAAEAPQLIEDAKLLGKKKILTWLEKHA